MNRTISQILLFLSITLMTVSCRSKQHVAGTVYNEDSEVVGAGSYNVNSVLQANAEWEDVTLNGSISVSTSSKMNSAMQMKMIKDKSISISIRPILGIEMGKIFISNENVIIVDKYHNLYLEETLENFIGERINVSSLQNLFLARAFVPEADNGLSKWERYYDATNADENGKWNLAPKEQDPHFSYNFDMEGNNVKRFNVEIPSSGSEKTYSIVYSGYRMTDFGIIASCLDIDFLFNSSPVKFQLLLNKSVRWNNGISDRVNIPDNARKVTFLDVQKLLSNQ